MLIFAAFCQKNETKKKQKKKQKTKTKKQDRPRLFKYIHLFDKNQYRVYSLQP